MNDRKISKIQYCNLHGHTTFSLFDGFGYPEEHLMSAWESGQDAMALSEHGNMNSLAHQYVANEKMNKEGKKIKNIYAIEAYFVPSLTKWKEDYQKEQEKKKQKEANIFLEDEEALKKGKTKGKNKRNHLLLLAKNQIGLNNLFKLVSLSYRKENFYRYPRIDREMLKKYKEGVICSSACIGSMFGNIIFQYKNAGEDTVIEKLRKEANLMLNIFGEDFYGELQWNNLFEQHILNQYVIQLSQELGFKLITTSDFHYPKKEDWLYREIYKRLGWIGKSSNNRPDWYNQLPKSTEEIGFELYPKNGDEIWESYKQYSSKRKIEYDDETILKSIEETCKIAFEKIEDFKLDTSIKLPSFVVPPNKSADSYLTRLCLEELKRKGLDKKSEYIERLKKELNVIKDRKFSKYFLTMKAITDKAKENMLCSPARGSCSGALISYLLGITQLNPIKYELQFERFLGKSTEGLPDIDFDISRPDDLKNIFKKEWGEYSVIPISNYSTLQIKSLIKDISKFYNVPFEEVNEITTKMDFEAIPFAKKEKGITAGVYTCSYDEYLKYSSTFLKFSEKYPMVGKYVEKLHGQIRNISRHASGCLVFENLNECMPLINTSGITQTPFPEGQTIRLLEPLGFVKFDLLGLSTLSTIEKCIEFILQRRKGIDKPSFQDIRNFYNEKLNPDIIDFSDQKVWKQVFEEGRFVGIFQFSNRAAQEYCKKVKPKNIQELSDVTSIQRPSGLSSGIDKTYLAVKNGEECPQYLCKEMEEVLSKTNSTCIYQEALAELVHKLGKNISLDEGNKFRKLVVKKGLIGDKNKEKEEIIKKFKTGCEEKGLTKEQTSELLKTLENFAGYGFARNHAIPYSIISYICAYLLIHYTIEWVTAFLSKESENVEKKEKAINLVKSLGIVIEPIDINKSDADWQIQDEKTVIQPFSAIKNLGSVAIEQIINNRPFHTIEELLFNENIIYNKLNKRSLTSLVYSGALEPLIDNRFNHLKHFWLSCVKYKPKSVKQLSENIEKYKEESDFSDKEKIEYLIDITGIYPLCLVVSEQLQQNLQDKQILPISLINNSVGENICWCILRSIQLKKTKHGKDYYVVTVTDSNSILTNIRIWGISVEKDKLYINHPYLVKLDYNEQYGFSNKGRVANNWKLLS